MTEATGLVAVVPIALALVRREGLLMNFVVPIALALVRREWLLKNFG